MYLNNENKIILNLISNIVKQNHFFKKQTWAGLVVLLGCSLWCSCRLCWPQRCSCPRWSFRRPLLMTFLNWEIRRWRTPRHFGRWWCCRDVGHTCQRGWTSWTWQPQLTSLDWWHHHWFCHGRCSPAELEGSPVPWYPECQLP